MELTPRLRLMNWLVSQGLTGLPENDLIRGFCERCCAEGLDAVARARLHRHAAPDFRGPRFSLERRRDQRERLFEYGSTGEGDAAQNWRSSMFYHMLENGHDELPIDLADGASHDFGIDRRPRRERPQAFRGLCAPVRRGRHDGPDGLLLFLLGDPARRGFWRAGHGGAARPRAGARACDQIRGAGRYRARRSAGSISAATPPSRCCAGGSRAA